jgi:o-succinylbenzoate synthase
LDSRLSATEDGGMRAEEVELRLVGLPLVAPFATAGGVTAVRELVLVRLTTDVGQGWGECSALAAPTYTEEYAEGAFDVLARHLVPRLLAAPTLDLTGFRDAVAPVRGHPMAKASLEMAVLDVLGRERDESLARWLGATRERVPAGVAVGIEDSVAALVEVVEARAEEGYRRVKLKIRPGWDVEPLAAVRSAVGEEIALVADANGAYRRGDVDGLRALDALDLAALEQPLPPEDLEGHALLARHLDTPVCLDESVTSTPAAVRALDVGAASAISVKSARVGGLVEARRLHDACVARGARAWVGGMLETGVGRAAAVALAALPGFAEPGDLSASSRYFAVDLTAPFELDGDGHLTVPVRPGLGVEVDLDAVAAATRRRTVLTRP